MPSTPVIPLATVAVFGGMEPDGEEHKTCRITMNGRPAEVVLYIRDLSEDKWVPLDRLTNASVTEGGGGRWTIKGASDALRHIVGTEVSNSEVRWEIQERGCANCG